MVIVMEMAINKDVHTYTGQFFDRKASRKKIKNNIVSVMPTMISIEEDD